jgi:co-chaperonin GroES (HSP10)
MKPKSDNIFLEPIDKKVTSLIVPPKARYRSKQFLSAKVIAIGRLVNQVQIGDEVAYAKDTGTEVEFDDKKMVVIKPRHILGVV